MNTTTNNDFGGRPVFSHATWQICADRTRSYYVRIVESLLDISNSALYEAGNSGSRRLIILDRGVPANVGLDITRYFAHHRVATESIVLDGGEGCKGFDTLQRLILAFDAFGLNRRTEPVIIVGGGALLDVAGFAASIYRRGVPYVRVPTTLLSYVDASVGAKTGINFDDKKNLLGSFSPPVATLLDVSFLRSLTASEISSGLGEILKLAVGCESELFDLLEANAARFHARQFDESGVKRILYQAVNVMLRELSTNLYEENLCRAVDLGHTFSQVLEMAQPASALRHGEAVALDINLTTLIAMHRGLLSRAETARVARLTSLLGLPMHLPDIDPERLWNSVLERRCHRGGEQRIPVPVRLGKCIFINDLERREVERAVQTFRFRRWTDDAPNIT